LEVGIADGGTNDVTFTKEVAGNVDSNIVGTWTDPSGIYKDTPYPEKSYFGIEPFPEYRTGELVEDGITRYINWFWDNQGDRPESYPFANDQLGINGVYHLHRP
jgi:hypothetical protein